jgi:hypothetical protein
MVSGTPADQSNAAWNDSDASNGGGFVNFRYDDPDRAELEAQHAARIRESFGDEAFERMERSRVLGRNPRPLSEEESAILWAAVAPLLQDMEATGQALPDIREEAHEDRGECGVRLDPGARQRLGARNHGVALLLAG